ncbi:DUF2752 domain-containing protein [Streptomyces beijiangensis]|uniref:DUF2752 domain-containing protein n=1 Tax=Streptomyces beijiangensis TaxID=163361 RepID=A0A939JL87_9ACTN|nr:DUF2752 domain-containing protein [Streptomyces beijiangensis]MBO0516140.1 DUF2752 domain-containing protein [Streptomyces beijiangensis]
MPERFRLLRHPTTAPLGVLVAGCAGAFWLYGHNPHEPGHLLPRCPFNWATGLLCPACGGTRMVYDLMHGNPAAAFHDNAALFLLGLPAAACLGIRWLSEGLRGRRYRLILGRHGQAAVLTTAVLWAIARNLTF